MPNYASRAEIAAYCRAHPEAIDELAEMLPDERAEHVYRLQHPELEPKLTEEEMREAMRAPLDSDAYDYDPADDDMQPFEPTYDAEEP